MPSSPDPRPPIFFEILCRLLLSSWPKASDEADGNTGRPQPGFFRMHRPGHFSLVIFPFSIPDPQGIREMPSSPDPRSPIFFKILCGLLLSSWRRDHRSSNHCCCRRVRTPGLNHARLVVRHRRYDGRERFRHRAQHCIGLGPDTSCRDDHFGQPLLDILATFLSIRCSACFCHLLRGSLSTQSH